MGAGNPARGKSAAVRAGIELRENVAVLLKLLAIDSRVVLFVKAFQSLVAYRSVILDGNAVSPVVNRESAQRTGESVRSAGEGEGGGGGEEKGRWGRGKGGEEKEEGRRSTVTNGRGKGEGEKKKEENESDRTNAPWFQSRLFPYYCARSRRSEVLPAGAGAARHLLHRLQQGCIREWITAAWVSMLP